MVAIMPIRTAARFMFWMRTTIFFTLVFIIVIFFIVAHIKSPLFLFIMEQNAIFHHGNYCHLLDKNTRDR